MILSGIIIGDMKRLISGVATGLVFGGLYSCRYCDEVKTTDTVMPRFTTKLSVDTFQLDESIPFYLESGIWPSLNYEDITYSVKQANLSFSVSVFAVTDSGKGDNITNNFTVTSAMASVKPRISGVDGKVFAYSIDWDLNGETFQNQPAFVVLPDSVGSYGLSFQIGSRGSIQNEVGKSKYCDTQVDMVGSFSENESPNLILDQAGISYQENVTLPGGSPHPIVRFYGFYVKP